MELPQGKRYREARSRVDRLLLYFIKLSVTKLKEHALMKRSPQLDRYERLVGSDLLARIYQTAESLAGSRVLHINTTARGGGVAELLQALNPLMKELGIEETRKVIQLDEASN